MSECPNVGMHECSNDECSNVGMDECSDVAECSNVGTCIYDFGEFSL
jgi:hypothetical protein